MKKIFLTIVSAAAVLVGCSDFMDPLPNGEYNDEIFWTYPSLVRGLVETPYNDIPNNWVVNEFIYADCATDNAVHSNTANNMRKIGVGSIVPSNDPVVGRWQRAYKAFYSVNKFLDGNRGFNIRYMVEPKADSLLRRRLQGEAYALRAWYGYDLLVNFGGKATTGEYLGYPIVTEPLDIFNMDAASIKRNTFEECLKQIEADCDSAFVYLPIAHRDNLAQDPVVEGSGAWHRLDGISAVMIKALAYLYYASPSINPTDDKERWAKAAEFAAEAIEHKLDVDVPLGFDPKASFSWLDPNTPETIWSGPSATNSNVENCFYPNGFRGNGNIGITQELVDAFPMANGYPIDDVRGNYDPKNPYANRDPRFYATVFYNGAEVRRITNNELMYTFETYLGGKDVAGGTNNSLTGYYPKKFIYMGWNKSDASTQTMPRSVLYMRWTQLLLTFAEAANRAVGPTDETTFGMSAKYALSLVRSRTTSDGVKGLGANGDPYLDEVAAQGAEAFDKLVRNERRIELCFEGHYLHDFLRWAESVDDLNKPVHKIVITKNSDNTFTYSTDVAEERNLRSRYLPIPYAEMKRAKGLVQNEGWADWK